MLADNVSLFVNRDCAITYSAPLQKTIIDFADRGTLPFGYFDYNSYLNKSTNQWTFLFKKDKNEFERMVIDGNKIRSISLFEDEKLLYKISDEEFINQLFLSQKPETLRNYLFFYS